jgi:hypothetical protein
MGDDVTKIHKGSSKGKKAVSKYTGKSPTRNAISSASLKLLGSTQRT